MSLTVEPIYLSVVSEHGWDPQTQLRPKFNLEALVASSYTRPRPDPHAAAGSPTSQSPASPGPGSAPQKHPAVRKRQPGDSTGRTGSTSGPRAPRSST